MNKELFKKFDDIPWPPRGELRFVEEIKEYEEIASPRTKKIYVTINSFVLMENLIIAN